jgi:hypothetical protein
MKLTLHVGLPKTATTYVQHSLSAQKQWLAERGVIYPGDSLEHHFIPKDIELLAAGRRKNEARVDSILSGFASEVAASGRDHVLISTEYLIETPPAAVALLDKKLRLHFPKLTEIRVLCYVREPIAFSTSFCQQVVKSAHQRLAQFYETPWPLNLRDCLSRYVGQFGRDAVELRNFHPDSLKNGDILDDFLDALGVEGEGLEKPRRSLNAALSDQALQIADALADIRPVEDRPRRYRRDYRRALEAIQGDRFVLPEEVQERVIAMSGDDLEMLTQDFGIELQPVRQPVRAGATLPSATANSLAELMVALVEGRMA